MRKLGTIDLEILDLAIKENGTFNENNLENSFRIKEVRCRKNS